MGNINILIADNDPDALIIYSEYLRSVGYNVLTAANVDAARLAMKTQRVHLAILDLRLTDDSELDRSGLLLAQDEARTTPKLILTKWPTFEDAREALKIDNEALPPAVDFLNKEDGLPALAAAVQQALSKYVRINQELVIQHNEGRPVSFLNLIGLLAPALSLELQQNGAAELEELFRGLFFEKTEIKIDRLIWQRDGRAAMIVFAFTEGHPPDALVVVCGTRERMEQEARRYREFAPAAPGRNSTVLNQWASTPQFRAHSYALAGAELAEVTVLEDLYRTASDRIVSTVLGTLFEETLAEWHRKQRVPSEGKSLGELYCKMLGLGRMEKLREKLENTLSALVKKLPSVGADVHRDSSRLTIHFGAQSYSYVDPAIGIGRAYGEPEPTVLLKTPGVLNGSNILTDGKNRTWLTDFADAALVPTVWNFVSLESVVRFDWANAPRIEWFHEMETLLVGPEFSKLYVSGVELPLRGTVRTVQHIRRFATRLMPRQEHSYQVGIFFHAVKRLVDHRAASQVTSNELLRLGHLLFAAAMLLERLTLKQGTRVPTSRKHTTKVQIDQHNRTVRINGVEMRIRGQAFDLLHELYLHANESCSRAKIVERIFGEKYEETNESQMSRLNTAIRRLREKIEDDPDDPQLLVTESGVGYKLIAVRDR